MTATVREQQIQEVQLNVIMVFTPCYMEQLGQNEKQVNMLQTKSGNKVQGSEYSPVWVER
jgi:hypothetical protein